ncbi:MAG TPA: amylo-alpha-1,6-glucosidase, partial [Casimicrobiaceae bacterium]
GRVDASIRPNQIFAVGGLPHRIVRGETARAVVATVERELLTPTGLRTLARGDPAYKPRCEGGVAERDSAYHQGTVWPWLIGAFVDAWLDVNGDDDARRAEARHRFLAPLQDHLEVAGLGHVSEIADGDPPYTPRGCPFQAWSLGELIRALARTAPAAS